MRIFLMICVFLIAAFAGWWLFSQSHQKEKSLQQQKIQLLTEENVRLRKIVNEIESKEREQKEQAIRTQIEGDVTKIRGLSFLKPIRYEELTRDDLPKIIEQKIAEQYTEEQLRDLQEAYIAIGLLPEGFNLRKAYVDLLGEQIAAFYDQFKNTLYTFKNTSLQKSQNRIVLAHELTHALQDQHFSLEKFPLTERNNDDMVLATASLIEGDATLLMADYVTETTSRISPVQLLVSALGQKTEQLQKTPRFLRESLLFPYIQGQKFCTTLYAKGGYRALDAAYSLPPKSTSQILHPEKYLADPGAIPPSIKWSGNFSKQGRLLTNNVLGEFAWRSLLSDFLPDTESAIFLQYWISDRYLVFKKDNTVQTASLSAWENVSAAEAFKKALVTMFSKRYEVVFENQNGTWISKGNRYIKIMQPNDTQVLFYDAPTAAALQTLCELHAEVMISF